MSAHASLGEDGLYASRAAERDGYVDIGERLELFVDHLLIEELTNTALTLHTPRLAPESPSPATEMRYGTIIQDGDLFRLYTRVGSYEGGEGVSSEATLYSESRDGVHWVRPNLGLVEKDGSTANNVILSESPFSHNFSPMLDRRPGVPRAERFKALAGLHRTGLVAFVSHDGIHWNKWRTEPVIPAEMPWETEKLFDSQNVSFWSESEGCYVCYFRTETYGLRRIARMTSLDYLSWGQPKLLDVNVEGEHLYTSQTHPYFRAPHIYIALPTRFFPERGNSTDILFMTARGDGNYDRTFCEAFIRPGLDPARWVSRANYAASGVIPTGANEMSIYATPTQRYVLRTDGFVSVRAGYAAGSLLTRPLRFSGNELWTNQSTSAGGCMRIEIQHPDGTVIPGFGAEDCKRMVGDAIAHRVAWSGTNDLSKLANQTVRLRFELQEADLYSIQFRR